MQQALRAGVIGLSLMGQGHSRKMRQEKRAKLVAVYDTLGEQASRLGEELGAHAYSDYREMLTKKHLDFVIVCTPDQAHREPVVEAARAAVRCVACQKPLATTFAYAEVMVESTNC